MSWKKKKERPLNFINGHSLGFILEIECLPSFFSHQTSYYILSSALHSPNLRAYLSHNRENLRTQSPWGKPVFPYTPNDRAFSFPFIFLFFISRPAVSPPVFLLPFITMSWQSLFRMLRYCATLKLPFFVDTKIVLNPIVDLPSPLYTPRLVKPPLSEFLTRNSE